VADAARDSAVLDLEAFAQAVRAGASAARAALTEPREGTLLSVLREFGDALQAHLQNEPQSDFLTLMQHGCREAEAALARLKRRGYLQTASDGRETSTLEWTPAGLTVNGLPAQGLPPATAAVPGTAAGAGL